MELARQLILTLRVNAEGIYAKSANYGASLVKERREGLSKVLPFTDSEQVFLDLLLANDNQPTQSPRRVCNAFDLPNGTSATSMAFSDPDRRRNTDADEPARRQCSPDRNARFVRLKAIVEQDGSLCQCIVDQHDQHVQAKDAKDAHRLDQPGLLVKRIADKAPRACDGDKDTDHLYADPGGHALEDKPTIAGALLESDGTYRDQGDDDADDQPQVLHIPDAVCKDRPQVSPDETADIYPGSQTGESLGHYPILSQQPRHEPNPYQRPQVVGSEGKGDHGGTGRCQCQSNDGSHPELTLAHLCDKILA